MASSKSSGTCSGCYKGLAVQESTKKGKQGHVKKQRLGFRDEDLGFRGPKFGDPKPQTLL